MCVSVCLVWMLNVIDKEREMYKCCLLMFLMLAEQELRLWCDWFEWTIELFVRINIYDAVTARVLAQKDPATIFCQYIKRVSLVSKFHLCASDWFSFVVWLNCLMRTLKLYVYDAAPIENVVCNLCTNDRESESKTDKTKWNELKFKMA